jgi:hypothetical protein
VLIIELSLASGFGSNEELTEERRQAGAVVESGVMTIISEEEFFTNFPESLALNNEVTGQTQ